MNKNPFRLVFLITGLLVFSNLIAANLAHAIPKLHDAARTGNIKLLKQLLKKGANINALDGTGFTPLHFAAMSGHKDVVEFLIGKGAKVNVREKMYQLTPLAVAKVKKHDAVAELLIKHGGKE